MGVDKLELAVVLIGFLVIVFSFLTKKTKVTEAISTMLSIAFVLVFATIVLFFLFSTPVKKEEVGKNTYNTKEELMRNVFFTNDTKLIYGDEYATYRIETTWKWLFLERKILSEHIIECKESN